MPNTRRCRMPCHRIPAQHRRSLWPRNRSAPWGGRGSGDAVWPHHDTLLRPLSDKAEALSTPGQTIPAVGSRAGARPRHGPSGTSFTASSPKICSCQSNRSPCRHPEPRRRVPPQSLCPAREGTSQPPKSTGPCFSLVPARPQRVPFGGGRSVAGGLTVCHHGSLTGTLPTAPERSGQPPVLPAPHRQHQAGLSPCAALGTRIPPLSRVPPCPALPRVPRPSASRAALTCPRSAQAELPPLPLPLAPSFTSAPFW